MKKYIVFTFVNVDFYLSDNDIINVAKEKESEKWNVQEVSEDSLGRRGD